MWRNFPLSPRRRVRTIWRSPMGSPNSARDAAMVSRRRQNSVIVMESWRRLLSAFRPRGVPGPTSKLSLRVPAQMGRRETEDKGETIRGITASCCPAPRADALAVGGYKRSRGRERACASARPPTRPPFRTRALDLPFIDVRRGSRCTTGSIAMC
jgi:hypothetical protein